MGSVEAADFSAALRTYAVESPNVRVRLLEQDVLHSFNVRVRNFAGLGDSANLSATPVIPSLRNATVLPSSNLSGANISLIIEFTLAMDLAVDDLIVISFPGNFSLGSARAFADISELTTRQDSVKLCGYRCAPSTDNLFISRNPIGAGNGDAIVAGIFMSVRLDGVVNRGWEGPSGTFQIRTVESFGNYTTSEALAVEGYSFVAGPLIGATASLGTTNTGDVTTLRVVFRSIR